MLKEGHKLLHFQRKFGFKTLNFSEITNYLVRRVRFDDCLDMLKTMRLTQQTFSSVMLKLCSYAQFEPELFKFIVSRVIKPFAAHLAPQKIEHVPVDLTKRASDQEIQARTYIDMLTRYFDTPHTCFKGCRASDYTWLSARYMAFDARTPETFLALPPSMRQSIRQCLWVTRILPRDLRNRIARVLVMQMFTADTALDLSSVVGDTRDAAKRLSTRDEIRLLFIQSNYAELLEKLTGQTGVDVSSLSKFCEELGSAKAGGLKLLELHQLLGDETCLNITHVVSCQFGMFQLTSEQQDYIVSRLKGRPVSAAAAALSVSPPEFQQRLLYHGHTFVWHPPYRHGLSGAVVEWLSAWKTWEPSQNTNKRYLFSSTFHKECRTLLLCFKRSGVTSVAIQHNIVRQLARLHGISYTLFMQHGALTRYPTKLRYVEVAKLWRVISLDPILTREQLYNASLPHMHPMNTDSVKRVKRTCKGACMTCLLQKWTLSDIHNTLVSWRAFSLLLREKSGAVKCVKHY
jgi:hypothetical protein